MNALSCKMICAMNKFAQWLNKEIEKRGWSYREFARRAGVSVSAVSDVINTDRTPSLKFYRGVSQAFRLPLDDVLRHAGVLPTFDADDPRIGEMLYYFEQLPEDLQDYLLLTARALAEHAEHHEPEKEKP